MFLTLLMRSQESAGVVLPSVSIFQAYSLVKCNITVIFKFLLGKYNRTFVPVPENHRDVQKF